MPAAAAAAPASQGHGYTPARDVLASLTGRVMHMVLQELSQDQTRNRVREHVVVPVIRMFMVECMPYAIALVACMCAIMLMSAITLSLSIMFYFGTHSHASRAFARMHT
jgi:hypothetical protein